MNYLFTLLIFQLLLFLLLGCQNTYTQGERLYSEHCANCHMADGKGLAALYPPLAGSDYLQNNLNKLPCIIRYGVHDSLLVNGVVYDTPMVGIVTLSDVEINNIGNYILQAWGNQYGSLTLPQTQEALKQCQTSLK